MRTTQISLIGVIAVATLTACTVKDVDTPALSGPSTFVHSITLVADRDTLTQNGSDFADIRVTSISPTGVSENISLRAQILVDGVVQDFGTLSTKTPITPATIRYTAPPASTLAAGSVPQTVTIEVTPSNNGDFRNEFARQVSIRLTPQGVILPTNPNLAAAFTFLPAAPRAFDVVTFNASTTTNNATACGEGCLYAWNFGDNTTGTGQVVTHQFRALGSYAVALTVTDVRGAQNTVTRSVTVTAAAEPTTVSFTFSPPTPGINQTIFFNASASRAAAGRTIVSYDWDFGTGRTATGVNVTKTFDAAGTYPVTLTVTDDAGAFRSVTNNVTVSATAGNPTANVVFSPAAPARNTSVFFDAQGSQPASAGAPIVSYRFTWGDGSSDTTTTSPTSSHTFTNAGAYTVRLTVTDSNGRTGTTTVTVTVS